MHVYIESVLPASLNEIKQRNSYILYHSDILTLGACGCGYSGRMEETEEERKPKKFEAIRIVEERERAIEEAERDREGLRIFTDGSKLGSGAAGYWVAWRAGDWWVGVNVHMGYKREAFDAECAALARALEVAARRRLAPKGVTIPTDTQAAMARNRIGRTGSCPAICQADKRVDSEAKGEEPKCPSGGPLVPRSQRSSRKRGSRQGGKEGGGETGRTRGRMDGL